MTNCKIIEAVGKIVLGRYMDAYSTRISFDVSSIIKIYGSSGTWLLLYERNDDAIPYEPNQYIVSDGAVVWTVDATDTGVKGFGRCELRYTVNDQKVWDRIYQTEVLPSMAEDAHTEDVSQIWLDQMLEYKKNAETAATAAAGFASDASASATQSSQYAEEIPGQVEEGKRNIDDYVAGKELELKGDTGNVYFSSFRVVNGRLKMYSDPSVTKIVFRRVGSRLKYRVATGG